MKHLEIRTTNAISGKDKYKLNLKHAILFLRNSEDKIIVRESAQSIEVEIQDNGIPLFMGSKHQLFDILRKPAITEGMGITELANEIANIIIDDYGRHNYKDFLEIVNEKLK